MKLGTDTNSMTNYLMSGTKGQPEPEIGMGVTFLQWTDRDAGTIISVLYMPVTHEAIAFTAQCDKATRTDGNGMSDCQTYAFEPNPTGAKFTYRRDRNGLWRQSMLGANGRWSFTEKGQSIRLGQRDKHHDFSF